MAVALDPRVVTESSRHSVEVECVSELTRGMTVVDRLNVSTDSRNRGVWSLAGGAPLDVVWKIDVPRWKAMLYNALSA